MRIKVLHRPALLLKWSKAGVRPAEEGEGEEEEEEEEEDEGEGEGYRSEGSSRLYDGWLLRDPDGTREHSSASVPQQSSCYCLRNWVPFCQATSLSLSLYVCSMRRVIGKQVV